MTNLIMAVHPVLAAKDVADSVRFFERLGFAPTFQDDVVAPRYAAVRRGPVELHLQWGDADQWKQSGDRPVYRILVSDVDALYAEFVATGGVNPEVATGPWAVPANTPWGCREFHLRDPGANILQFYQPVPE